MEDYIIQKMGRSLLILNMWGKILILFKWFNDIKLDMYYIKFNIIL
jgi:hypothetical protein